MCFKLVGANNLFAFYNQVGSKSKYVLDEQLTCTIQYGVYLIIDYSSGMFCLVGHGNIVVYMQLIFVCSSPCSG